MLCDKMILNDFSVFILRGKFNLQFWKYSYRGIHNHYKPYSTLPKTVSIFLMLLPFKNTARIYAVLRIVLSSVRENHVSSELIIIRIQKLLTIFVLIILFSKEFMFVNKIAIMQDSKTGIVWSTFKVNIMFCVCYRLRIVLPRIGFCFIGCFKIRVPASYICTINLYMYIGIYCTLYNLLTFFLERIFFSLRKLFA